MSEDTLTRRQRDILTFLREHARSFDHPPNLDELAAALGLRSRGSLHKQIQALVEAGFVEPMRRTRRGIRLTGGAEDPSSLPMLGRIAAGGVRADPVALAAGQLHPLGKLARL